MVRSTALLRYHAHMRSTLTFNLDLWPWLSISSQLRSWPTQTNKQTRTQNARSVDSKDRVETNWRTDGRTDGQTPLINLTFRLTQSVTKHVYGNCFWPDHWCSTVLGFIAFSASEKINMLMTMMKLKDLCLADANAYSCTWQHEIIVILANVNSRSRSLYATARPSAVCL